MILFNKAYCTIWDIKPSEKYTDIRISTSEKNRDGNYVNSNWFARCIGKAHNQIKNFEVKDRAIILSGKVTNETYEKDGQKRSVLRVLIYDLEKNEPNTGTYEPTGDIEDDDDLPF